jgi:hypothetical protein
MDNEEFFRPLNNGQLMALARHGIKLKDAQFVKDAFNELARRFKKEVYGNG